jgi:hypothetical protein
VWTQIPVRLKFLVPSVLTYKYCSLTVHEYDKHFLHAHSSWLFLFIINWTRDYNFLTRFSGHNFVGTHSCTYLCANLQMQCFFLMKDWTMKIFCWIVYLFARVMNSDLRLKRSEQAELSHGAVLNTLSVTHKTYCTFCLWYVCIFVF